MGHMLTKSLTFLFFYMAWFAATQAQTIPQEFWDNPNVIWKTSSGTIITGSFAKKMHVEGNYTFEERAMSGSRKEIRMIPPGKKSTATINWNDSNLTILDEYKQVVPRAVAQAMLRVIENKWETDTLDSGEIVLTVTLNSGRSAWSYAGMESISGWVEQWRGKPLPYFKLKNQYDELVTNSTALGKILVLHFWNSNCIQCKDDMPELNKVKEAFGNDDVVFLAPNYEGDGTVEMFMRNETFEYQVLSSSQSFFDDLELGYHPTNMIVGRDGTILDINVGGGPTIGAEIAKKLSWLLYD